MCPNCTAPECWRPVPYEPFDTAYEVSSRGRVRRTIDAGHRWKAGHVLTPMLERGGYPRVALQVGRERLQIAVHQLMAVAFLGPKPHPKAIVRHLDDCKTNNVVLNLAWGTYSDNLKDMFTNGRDNYARGERAGKSKLNDASVRSIRVDAANGVSWQSLAKRHHVDVTSIEDVVKRRSWKHID